MNRKKIAILGSTGSIGESAMRVVDASLDEFEVVVLSASGNKIQKIKDQCKKYKPKYVILEQNDVLQEIKTDFSEIVFLNSENGYKIISEAEKLDVTIVGMVGVSGLKPSFILSTCSKIIAIANKESILYGGQLMLDWFKKHNCKMIPVDSEHNSLYQILDKIKNKDEVKKLIITASGGSFRNFTGDLKSVSLQDVMSHPKWSMGYKNTIDSANLVNKGIELIEAAILFNIEEPQIECIIHPEVIIHAMIEMQDNSMFSFLSNPDMSLHLANAMRDNNKRINLVESIDLIRIKSLNFEEINHDRFPGVKIARSALKSGTPYIMAFNAADEALTQAFIDGEIQFTDITDILQEVLAKIKPQQTDSLDNIIEYDGYIKLLTRQIIKKVC